MSIIGVVELPEAATGVTPIGCPAPVSETLPGAIARIVEAIQPQRVVLFGSYAYGVPTPDSDVDLLVIKETNASRVERYTMVSEALWPRQFPVDIIVRTPEELRQALEAGDFFMQEIVRRGQVLYEQPG
jgi:predicted nucleotidyltransferase